MTEDNRIIQDAFCVYTTRVEAVYLSYAAAAIKKVQIGGVVRKCKVVLIPGSDDQRPEGTNSESLPTAEQW